MSFNEVFGADGLFMRIGTEIWEIIYANILWLIFGGPFAWVAINYIPLPASLVGVILYWLLMLVALLHMGPATTAAFSAVGKRQRKEETYTFRDFWHSYKQNYKQGLLVMGIVALVIILLIYAIWLEYMNAELYGKMLYVVIPIQGFVILELICCFSYMFALLARFEMSTKNLLKYSFLMANKHLPTTIITAAMFVACIAAFLFWNMASSFFMFGLYFYFSHVFLENVFRNYMPDEDEAAEEEVVEGYDMDAERQAIIDRYTGKIGQNGEKK